MNELHTEIISGKDVSQADLDVINEYRRIRLDRTSTWDHVDNPGFEERTFFLVKNSNNQLLSFGTLRPVKIYIETQEYTIWGIQAVISVVQGKGYGKLLMHSIKEFVEESGITLIGFCEKKNSEFYKKSGCSVFEDGCDYFVYLKESGERILDTPGDVLYINGKDRFMDEVIRSKKEVIHYISHW